jgi:hypothetical protein
MTRGGAGGGRGRCDVAQLEAVDVRRRRRWLETTQNTSTAAEDAGVIGAGRQPGATASSTASWLPTSGCPGQLLSGRIRHLAAGSGGPADQQLSQ